MNSEGTVFLNRSIDMFAIATNLQKNNEAAWRGLGYSFLYSGQVSEALGAWQNVPAIEQELIDWGHRARDNKNFHEAIRWYEYGQSLSATPNEEIQLSIGIAYLEMAEGDAARNVLESARREFPHNRDLLFYLGQAYALDEQAEKALEILQQALNAPPAQVQLSDIHFQIAHIQQTVGWTAHRLTALSSYDRAISLDAFSEALNLKPQTYYERGHLLLSNGDYKKALLDFDKVIELDPAHYFSYLASADALKQLGKLNEAYGRLSLVIALFPKRKAAYFQLGSLYAENGRLDLACTTYSKILEIDGDDQRAKSAINGLAERNVPACLSLSISDQ